MQSWSTLRFDDHRGLLPRDFIVSSTGLQARLTRSKVSGSDKHLNFRTVIIHSSAYIQRRDWLAVGWNLLLKGAPHERDYLLPAPTNNFHGYGMLSRIESFRGVNRALLCAAQRP